MQLNDITTKLEKHIKGLYIIGGIIILALFIHTAMNIFMKPKIAKDIPVVRTITVGDSSSTSTYTYPGEVRGKHESNLAFQVAGKIVQRNVQLGDTVRAGQVLMTIDPKDVAQALNANQAAVNAASASYKLAKDNASRYGTLYAQGAVSEAIRDQYKTQYEAAAATLEQAEAQLTATEHQMEYTKLVADHDGVVASISGEIGMVTAAGTPVITVVQAGEREIQIFVPEGRLNTVRPGQNCTITFWALSNVTARGVVTEVSPMADPTTKTYKVRVALDNMPLEAKLGMTAKVTLEEGQSSALLIPRSAIYQTANTPSVWVVKDNKVTLVPIKVNGYKEDKVVVLSGLNAGDIVVTGGISKLA